MSSSTPLAFVYFDGPEVYVHPAEVRTATVADLHYAPTCVNECGEPILAGQTIAVTDPGVQGESWCHLGCMLATGGYLATLAEAEEVQGQVPAHTR